MKSAAPKSTKQDTGSEVSQPRAAWMHPLVVWPLFTGLALGYIIGRESGGGQSGGGAAQAIEQPAALAVAPSPAPAPTPAVAPSAVRPTTEAATAKLDIPATSPRKGAKTPKVTIVEVSDFQCPFCSKAIPAMKELEQKYPNDVAFVFMHQPLSFHADAIPAAIASMAAGRQGKFWEMHDKLFANQQALKPADFERYATELKLDVARFQRDSADPKVRELVLADQRRANDAGASATPSFFVNGRKLEGAKPVEQFVAVIDEEIKKADALIAKGIPLSEVSRKLTDQAVASAGQPLDIPVGDSPVKGPAKAAVTIIEFSEFQCPYCSKVGPTLKQVEAEFKGKVRIAFKHLPLPFHNNAQIAAEAAMAAHEQGKFWEMHDKLFANQQALERPALEKYAQELGLNMTKFRATLDSGKYKAHVQRDAAQAASVGATGTPTFFLNGKKLVGAKPFEEFKRLIEEELRKAS